MNLSRRRFIHAVSLAAASGTGLFSVASQGQSDYRALVCLFLIGGLDCHDILIPSSASNFSTFSQRRQSLLDLYGDTRDRSALLPLNDPAVGGWALPPELASCKALYDSGEMALVANVGPLIEPTNRRAFEDNSVPLPPQLFSHNDQQATWQSGATEGAQYGWGGLFADAFLGASADSEPFATIATAQSGAFLTGVSAVPYQLSTGGSARFDRLEAAYDVSPVMAEMLRSHLAGASYTGSHLIRRDLADKHASASATNEQFASARAFADPLGMTFPSSDLGRQLRAVAETIALRGVLGVDRQVFFIGIGGFDTHSGQASRLSNRLQVIDAGLAAFRDSMWELGVQDQVTLFTASDFGRTLSVNGDGTDHGWGGHHIVLGGAVNGGRIFGTPTPLEPDHDQDAGSGRLIPSLSVEQYAEPMGQWFGLSNAALLNALPRLRNFDRGTLPLFG